MAATKTKTTTPAAVGKANTTLELTAEPGKTIERKMADVVGSGLLGNASVMRLYAAGIFGELDITECARALKASVGAVKAGDLSAAEGMLMTQAVALNAIFGELARRAASNMGEYPDAFERYMRLALKSQGQCRATIETLATIKNPPMVFARQATGVRIVDVRHHASLRTCSRSDDAAGAASFIRSAASNAWLLIP